MFRGLGFRGLGSNLSAGKPKKEYRWLYTGSYMDDVGIILNIAANQMES